MAIKDTYRDDFEDLVTALVCSLPGMRSFATLLAFAVLATARPVLDARVADCTGTISSLSDVAAAVKCTTVTINKFTVDAGKTFELDLLDGTTVNMAGNVTFGVSNWAGPLLQIE